MHSKLKGNIGQFAISLALAKLGFSIFSEEGDISKIDLVAEKFGKLLRFQCKAITPVNGCLHLPLKKSGPGYKFKYTPTMFDYFAVYDLEDGRVYAISATILDSVKNTLTLRKIAGKNGQTKHVHKAADYEIGKVLNEIGAI
jgi:hypothetical protein